MEFQFVIVSLKNILVEIKQTSQAMGKTSLFLKIYYWLQYIFAAKCQKLSLENYKTSSTTSKDCKN